MPRPPSNGFVFPPHIATVDEALDFLPLWAERKGGLLRDGLMITDDGAGYTDVADFHVGFAATDTVLTVGLRFTEDLRVNYYKFDLRRADGTLLWREDNHPGHVAQHGGPHHVHVGPEEHHRIAAEPATLTTIAEKVVVTHLSIG